jgi:hypothetical protein
LTTSLFGQTIEQEMPESYQGDGVMLFRIPLCCLISLIAMVSVSAEWLEFNAGTPENTCPLVQHNNAWDDFLTFDVELRGLLADTIEVDSTEYLRFNRTPGTVPSDSVGYPELPIVRCFIWVPDSTDLSLQYALNCLETIVSLPVYPVPLDSIRADSVVSPYIDEFFRKDSTAYESDEWFPDTLVRLTGEFHLRDARVAVIDVYPVQYLADDDSLRVWSDIEIMLTFDDTTEVWPTRDLGPFEDLIGDRLLGYEPDDNPWAPVPGLVMRPDSLEEGPNRVPDYVILVADGLDGNWIDTLGRHRADLCGFDVAIVRTDSVVSQFGSFPWVLTPTVIRDFTETMWDWGQPESSKRPSYLLLIGDHEDSDSSDADWFLPTHIYEYEDWIGGCSIGDDDWYVYLDEPYATDQSFPDMMVGRLSVRQTDTLEDMIDVIRDYEAASTMPAPDSLSWRRYITLLEEEDARGWNTTDSAWTDSLRQWCGYDWDYVYGGDFRSPYSPDNSTMTSLEWDSLLTAYFVRGQQLVIYVDHGLPHLFCAGLDYGRSPPLPPFQGIPDSAFTCFDVDSLSFEEVSNHGYPFIINACCATGRFFHTASEHDTSHPEPRFYYCQNDLPEAGPEFDFLVDCIGEKFLKNTTAGAIGFFAGSSFTYVSGYYGLVDGIASAVLCKGITRVGDAIASMRFSYAGSRFITQNIALYNLLGDPAVDLGDRVKFRDYCDLIVSPPDLEISRYPTLPVGGGSTASLHVTIRNAGADSSGSFDAILSIDIIELGDSHDTTLTETFPNIAAGQDTTLTFDGWNVPDSLTSDMDIVLICTADTEEDCSDSWTANNEATRVIRIKDFYPNEDGWPVLLPGSIKSPPLLVDLDDDGDLDIVVVVGSSRILAIDPEDPDDPIWSSAQYEINKIGLGSGGSGYSIPVAGDVTGDGNPEIVVDTIDKLIVLDGSDGDLMCSFSHADLGDEWTNSPHSPVLADVFEETGFMSQRDEIACVCADKLYILRYESNSLVKLDSIDVTSNNEVLKFAWLASSELDGNDGDDLVVATVSDPSGSDQRSTIALYSSDSLGDFYDSRTWSREIHRAIPAVGDLGAGVLIAISKRLTSSGSPNPVDLLNPSNLTTAASCSTSSTTSSKQVLCCVMADWVAGAGLDRVIAPAENQCFVFKDDGAEDWYDVYPGTPISRRPPFPALGDLDDDGWADFLCAINEGVVYAYDRNGENLDELDFPYVLPSEVSGGFLIADIDDDANVEVVFGTMDNYLHVWELGDCDSSYAPWPQVQHDAMRTGVLE